MSKPKTLTIFDRVSEDTAYSRLNTYINVTKVGNSLKLNIDKLDGNPMITFKAPCNCEDIDTILFSDESYGLYDTSCTPISSEGNVFVKDALVTIVLDTEKKRAYLQNGNITSKADKVNPVFPENISVEGEVRVGKFTLYDDRDNNRLMIYRQADE